MQGDFTAMIIYALGIASLLTWLSKKLKESTNTLPFKQVAFPDNLNEIGTLKTSNSENC